MPNGDYGIFTPTEAAYTKPGTYEAAIRGEATKRGAYLSSMDQFYAQLEEMERQFGEKLAFEEKRLAGEEERWEEELEWLREQETGRLGLERERMGTQRYLGRLAVTGGGRQDVTGGPFEPYKHTSELHEEEGITMDWLTQQLGRIYPTPTQEGRSMVGGAPPRPTGASESKPTGYSTPGPLPVEFYRTGEETWRNF